MIIKQKIANKFLFLWYVVRIYISLILIKPKKTQNKLTTSLQKVDI